MRFRYSQSLVKRSNPVIVTRGLATCVNIWASIQSAFAARNAGRGALALAAVAITIATSSAKNQTQFNYTLLNTSQMFLS